MTNILNPYIAGAPVVETSMFFGREDIFSWIERSLTGKFVNHILVLHGQRRVGKTSVLKQIPHHLPKHYTQVFYDLQGRTNTTLERFLWWMASEISRTLKKECNLDLPKIERNAFADPEAFINDFLPSLRALIGEKILLLTFDEFDTLDRPDIQDSLARPLVAYLRRLMEIEGLNFIFSIGSSGNKLENMQASYTDFFKSALYRKVSFLTKDDCARLITKPVEGTISYEPAAVEKISYFTSGHPYFTQLMCHELFSRCQKTGSRSITAGDVDLILEDVIERGTVNLKFVWDEASDLEKWILAALAQEESASLKQVHQILKSQGLRTNESDLNSAILHLRDKDVLTADNGFVIQLLKLWLQANRPMDRVREELVQTNPITDRYIEIGDEYRERGENQQAIQSYEQALAVQENDIRALQNIAAIYLLQNSFEAAVKYFARILLIDEENIAAKQGFIQSQIYLAKKAIKVGDEVEAEKAIRSILMIAPSHVEATKLFSEMYVQKAEKLLQNGQEDQAFEKFQQAIEISPDDEAIKTRYEKIIADKRAAQVLVWLEKAEKSLTRQRWDEAANMVEEAINIDPENPDLHKRLLEIKDAPRQEKIKAYKQEAEQAIAKGNYPKAISAIQTAILLASEDSSLKHWLDSIQSDQANAQLRMYQSQADQAEVGGNWEAAIAAREAALKLDPQNERLAKALQSTKEAKQKQHINSLRLKIDRAKKEQNWEAALAAGEEYLQFSPEDQDIKNDLQNFRIEQRKSRLAGLKTQALSASKAEKWEDAIQHWQAYLAEKPEDGARVEKLIEQAKQKAALLKDYETAQLHIRKHQYNRAIHLLQGIIAKDPTYKASSRLLVEAVEANKQKKPIWRTPWIYVGGGVLLLAVVALIMLPQIKIWINPSQEPITSPEVVETQATLETSQTVIYTPGYAIERIVSYQTSLSTPTFQDDFDEENPQPYWESLLPYTAINLDSDGFKMWDGARYTNDFLFAENFWLEFEYSAANGYENNVIHIDLNSGNETFYRYSIFNDGRFTETYNGNESETKLIPELTSYRLKNDYTTKVKLIKIGNDMTVFVNEQPLVGHKDLIQEGNLQIVLHVWGSQPEHIVMLHSIKFWNLDVPDVLNSILTQVKNSGPTFQDDFDIFSPQPYWKDLLENQTINPKQNGWEMFGDNYFANEMLLGKEFVIEYEYVPQNYDANIFINTCLLGDNPDFNFTFSLDNSGRYKYKFGQIATSLNSIPSWSETLEQNNFIVKVNLIVAKNTLAVYVNDTAVVLEEDIFTNGNLITEIRFDKTTDNYSIAMLNTIKFWNLEGMEFDEYTQPVIEGDTSFYDQIITFINENPPTFEDDFSTAKEEWGKISVNQGTMGGEEMVLVEHQISDFIQNEKLEFKIDVDQRGYITFPTDGFLDANQFIITFEYKIDQNSIAPDNDIFGFKFHQSTEKDSHYDLNFIGNGDWQLVDNKISNNQLNILNSGTFTKLDTQSVMIAVFNDNLIVQINDQIAAQIEGITSNDNSNSFYFTATGYYFSTLDNVQFWNLDEVGIEQNEIENQVNQTDNTPTWEVDYLKSALEYTQNRAPDIEDNFDNPSNTWVLPNYVGYEKSFEEGEMIITGEAENTLMTYFDYVAEVEIRTISGIGDQGIGWDNGSAIHCRFIVANGQNVEISCDENLQRKIIISKDLYSKKNLLKFKLILKNGFMAFYLNDELLGHYENEQYRLYRSFPPTFSVGTLDANTAGIDNFRVWNISDLEIP